MSEVLSPADLPRSRKLLIFGEVAQARADAMRAAVRAFRAMGGWSAPPLRMASAAPIR